MIILIIVIIILIVAFGAFDPHTGANAGTLTAVDKNFFGTYSVFINDGQYDNNSGKTGYTYCIDADNAELIAKVQSMIGKKVKVSYPETRFGFYTWDKCKQAPLKEIEEAKE